MSQIYSKKEYRRFIWLPLHLRFFVVSSTSLLLVIKFWVIKYFIRCSLWLTYGKLTNETSVVIVNTIGSMLFLLYTVVYYVFTVSKSSFLKQFFMALVSLLLTVAYVQYETDIDKATQMMGTLNRINHLRYFYFFFLFCRTSVLLRYGTIFCCSVNDAITCD